MCKQTLWAVFFMALTRLVLFADDPCRDPAQLERSRAAGLGAVSALGQCHLGGKIQCCSSFGGDCLVEAAAACKWVRGPACWGGEMPEG